MKFPGKALLLILPFLPIFSCNKLLETTETISVINDTIINVIPDPVYMFGIPVDSFDLESGQTKRNSFISEILLGHGVPMTEIDQAIRNSKTVFDVRKVLPGRDYFLFCDRDSIGRARYMVYEHDPMNSYVFSFNDSMNITLFRKELSKEIRYATGTIESSLWEAMMKGGLHSSLAVELENIFSWTVDFFGLQKGDSFKVIYEELFVEDKSLGTGKIIAARFTSSGSTYTAIPFIQDGKESFFDVDGKSLRKAFLKAPLKFSRISSRYSPSRMHPVLRIRRPHFGVDYAAPSGTPVYTIGDGKVISVSNQGASGRMVKIKHNSTYTTAYLHLSRFAPGITSGSMVKQGQVIGFVGSSGLSTGPHLDFRFYRNGVPVDPLRVIAPPSEPVTGENMPKFEIIKEVSLSLLDTF